jgi:DNA repair exonuclease SbcCD ATPase subunit
MMDLKNKHRQELDEKVAGKRDELYDIQVKINDIKASISLLNRSIQHNETEISRLEARVEKLRTDWHEENSKAFEFAQSETCPTCGQALPAEQLESAREKALADFNRKKAEKLEAINAEGKQLASLKSSYEEELNTHRKTIEKYTKDLAELEQKEAALKTEIDNIMQGAEPVESTEAYRKLQERIQGVRSEIETMQENNDASVKAIQEEVYFLTDSVTALEQAQARLESRKNGEKRIEELKAEERKLAAEYEELEQQLYLTEEFIRTKVQLLEDKINNKFRMARFKLFDVQVNGALSECCETTFNGVPYSNLNNGARLNIGLDIINTLAEHYGFSPPVWLDNAESVTNILPTKGQQIRLIVSATDKELRVELEEKEVLKEVI